MILFDVPVTSILKEDHMKNLGIATAFFATLCAASPALAYTSISGTTINGGLETTMSSDLIAFRATQSLHPTAADPGNGVTNPSYSDPNQLFQNDNIIMSLAAQGPAIGLKADMKLSTPAQGDINGQIWHSQVILQTPAVGYYGMGISSNLGANIYVAGATSNSLYYGLRVSESTTGGEDGGNTGNSHTLFAKFNDSPNIQRTDSNFIYDEFGSSRVMTWSGGSIRPTFDGNGFVSFQFQDSSMHAGYGVGLGQVTTYDLWLTLSDTPITSMPVAPVPLPGAVWLLGSGFVGLIGARRKKKA